MITGIIAGTVGISSLFGLSLSAMVFAEETVQNGPMISFQEETDWLTSDGQGSPADWDGISGPHTMEEYDGETSVYDGSSEGSQGEETPKADLPKVANDLSAPVSVLKGTEFDVLLSSITFDAEAQNEKVEVALSGMEDALSLYPGVLKGEYERYVIYGEANGAQEILYDHAFGEETAPEPIDISGKAYDKITLVVLNPGSDLAVETPLSLHFLADTKAYEFQAVVSGWMQEEGQAVSKSTQTTKGYQTDAGIRMSADPMQVFPGERVLYYADAFLSAGEQSDTVFHTPHIRIILNGTPYVEEIQLGNWNGSERLIDVYTIKGETTELVANDEPGTTVTIGDAVDGILLRTSSDTLLPGQITGITLSATLAAIGTQSACAVLETSADHYLERVSETVQVTVADPTPPPEPPVEPSDPTTDPVISDDPPVTEDPTIENPPSEDTEPTTPPPAQQETPTVRTAAPVFAFTQKDPSVGYGQYFGAEIRGLGTQTVSPTGYDLNLQIPNGVQVVNLSFANLSTAATVSLVYDNGAIGIGTILENGTISIPEMNGLNIRNILISLGQTSQISDQARIGIQMVNVSGNGSSAVFALGGSFTADGRTENLNSAGGLLSLLGNELKTAAAGILGTSSDKQTGRSQLMVTREESRKDAEKTGTEQASNRSESDRDQTNTAEKKDQNSSQTIRPQKNGSEMTGSVMDEEELVMEQDMEEPSGGIPLWAWIGGGVVVAGGITGGIIAATRAARKKK